MNMPVLRYETPDPVAVIGQLRRAATARPRNNGLGANAFNYRPLSGIDSRHSGGRRFMSRTKRLAARMRGMLSRGRMERQLEDEIRFHIEMQIAQLLRLEAVVGLHPG